MRITKTMQIYDEIAKIKGKRSKVHAVDLVDWAKRHPDSALYKAFEWDDTIAAQQYRLQQAAQLIRLHISKEEGVRTFVSLSVDRVTGGGYRHVQDVVKDTDLRTVMVADALAEFQRVRMKYRHLQEFVKVFEAVDEVAETLGKPKAA